MKKRGYLFFLVVFMILLAPPLVSSHWLDDYRSFINFYGSLITGSVISDEDDTDLPDVEVPLSEEPVPVEPIASFEPPSGKQSTLVIKKTEEVKEKQPTLIVSGEGLDGGEEGGLLDAGIYVGGGDVASYNSVVQDQECMNTIKSQDLLFGHQSLGEDIRDGLSRLGILTIQTVTTDPTPFVNADILGGFSIQANTKPLLKINDFNNRVRNYFNQYIDSAFFKFSFVDVDTDSGRLPGVIFPRYRSMMDSLMNNYTEITFMHWTVPLMVNMDAANINRNRLSWFIIDEYLSNSVIFDIADIESTNSAGVCTFNFAGRTYRRMCPEYTTDGGHLNVIGQDRVAKAFIVLLSKVYCGKIPPFDFAISVDPKGGSLEEGQSTTAIVRFKISGTTKPIVISASNLSTGVSVRFNPKICTNFPCQSVMNISVSNEVTGGINRIIVTGTSTEKIRSAYYDLRINKNRPPVLDPIGNKNAREGEPLLFRVTASDPDNDPLVFNAFNLPSGAFFNRFTRIFSWTPGFNQAGVFRNITFIVRDNATVPLFDREGIIIFVNNSLDYDKDGIPNVLDCNDNNTQVGRCGGCARCSDPQGISGSCEGIDNLCEVIDCPHSICRFGMCNATTQYAIFNKTQQQTCKLFGDYGACGPRICTPIACGVAPSCESDIDGDGVYDFNDKCPKTPPWLHSLVSRFNGCPRPYWDMARFHPNLTTNFSAIFDLFNVSLKLGTYGKGQIWFVNQKVPLLVRNMSLSSTSPYYMHYYPIALKNIVIDHNKISIDTKTTALNYLMFNKPARLKLFELSFSNPRILKDGNVCSECSILSYVNGDLEFEVPGFSTYTAGETPSGSGSSYDPGGSRGGDGPPVRYVNGDRTAEINLDEKVSYEVYLSRFGKILITYNNNLYSIRTSSSRTIRDGIDIVTSPNREKFGVSVGDTILVNLDPFPNADIKFTFKGNDGRVIKLFIERIDKKIPSLEYPGFDKLGKEVKESKAEKLRKLIPNIKEEIKKGFKSPVIIIFVICCLVALFLVPKIFRRFSGPNDGEGLEGMYR